MRQLKHIAFICDGNGRWAKSRGMIRTKGHSRGAEVIKEVVELLHHNYEVERATFYVFSTENWSRPQKEVDYIMKALDFYLNKWVKSFLENGFRIKFVGDTTSLNAKVMKTINKYEELTKDCANFTIQLAFNYGGREEILTAIRKMIDDGVTDISEETLNEYLYVKDEPDLIVRTSGEMRLSNFLLWQAAYSELYFTDVMWPDFDEKQLELAIESYVRRDRRFGSIKEESYENKSD